MVGLQVLVLGIGVRIPAREQRKISLKLAEFFVYPDSRIEPEYFLYTVLKIQFRLYVKQGDELTRFES